MSEIRVLAEREVQQLIDRDLALAFARETLTRQASDGSRLSSPSAMRLDATAIGAGKFMFKAATVGYLGAAGIRLIAWPEHPRAKGRPSIYTLMFDQETGKPVGLVAGAWLSDLRAAAFAVAVMELLVLGKPLTIGLFGTGSVAREIALMSFRAFALAEMRVLSRHPERAREFVRQLEPGAPCVVRPEVDASRVTDAADLIITATSANEPLVRRGMVAPGAVVCSMGSAHEVAFEVLEDADRLIVDDPEYAAEMGDGGAWIAQGRITRRQFEDRVDALAADVAADSSVGRRSADDTIVALVQGMSTGDIAFANLALRLAQAQSVGTCLTLLES